MRYLLLMLLSIPSYAQEWGRYADMPVVPSFSMNVPNLSQMQMQQHIWAFEMAQRQRVTLPPVRKGDFVTPPVPGQNRPK